MLEEFNEERSKTEAKVSKPRKAATIEVDGEVYISASTVKSCLEGLYCGMFATRSTLGEAYDYANLLMRDSTDTNSVDYSLAISIGVYQNTVYRSMMENLELPLNEDASEY